MHLLLRRTQRDASWFAGYLGPSMVFNLDARLELNREERRRCERYDLYDLVVYDSADREAYEQASADNFKTANDPKTEWGDYLWYTLAGFGNWAMMPLSLRITYRSLCDGQHIESESLKAILETEETIFNACKLLASHLEVTLTFNGSETLHEI